MGKIYLIKERTLRDLRRKVVVDPKFYDLEETESERIFTRKAQSDYSDPAEGTTHHDWQITYASESGGHSICNIAGGTIATQGAFGFDELYVPAHLGFLPGKIYLSIVRHAATREIISANFYHDSADPPEASQLIFLGEFFEGGAVHQAQFQPLNIFEDLAVIDGVFKLVPLAMNGTSPYDLPT